MNKKCLKEIGLSIPSVTDVLNLKRAPVFIVDGMSQSLLKGFCLYEAPGSIMICEWFNPCLSVPKKDFLIYYDFFEFEKNVMSLDKHGSDDRHILSAIRSAAVEHLEHLKTINSIYDLAQYFVKKEKSWMLNPMNRINLSILFLVSGNEDKCISLLESSLFELSEYYPQRNEVIDFYQRVKEKDLDGAINIIELWKEQVRSDFDVAISKRTITLNEK